MTTPTPSPRDARVFQRLIWTLAPQGLQGLHARMSELGLDLLRKHGLDVYGCWVPDDANEHERLMCIVVAPNREDLEASWQALDGDTAWLQICGGDKPHSTLMQLTDYSPAPPVLDASSAFPSRAYEFRTYVAASGRLADLNTRFRNHTVRLFEKHGLKSVAYWNLLPGEEECETTLFYLLSHPSRAAGETALQRFMADTEWKAALAESQVNGSLVAPPPLGVQSAFHQATAYSPLR